MARQSILKTLDKQQKEEQGESAAEPQEQPAPAEPQEQAAPAEPQSGGKTTSRRAPARKATRRQGAARKPAATEGAAAGEATDTPKREAPKVLKPESTSAASRISLYLHPDDKRALGLAKLDDAVDENSRIRALLALWRHDERLRNRVDKLAQQTRNEQRG